MAGTKRQAQEVAAKDRTAVLYVAKYFSYGSTDEQTDRRGHRTPDREGERLGSGLF